MLQRILALMQGRSGRWPDVRAAHLKREPACAVCGARKGVEVHHVEPFHLWPARELDPTNLITLCKVHHLWVGHLGNWESWNADVRADAAAWREKIKNRPVQPKAG